MLKQCPPFTLPAPEGILSGRQRGDKLLVQFTDRLRRTNPDGVTQVDFFQVSVIDKRLNALQSMNILSGEKRE